MSLTFLKKTCEGAVEVNPWQLYNVSYWFVVLQDMWYEDFDDDDVHIEWYDSYQKCKAQKAQIKKELIPIVWHPSRWWDWCVPNGGKQDTEKL